MNVSKVRVELSMSLDGLSAWPNDSPGKPLGVAAAAAFVASSEWCALFDKPPRELSPATAAMHCGDWLVKLILIGAVLGVRR